MLEKLQKIEERLREVERPARGPRRLYRSAEARSPDARAEGARARSSRSITRCWRAQQAQEEAEQMLSDPELRELAQEERTAPAPSRSTCARS